jgi:hypothetical protein
VHGANFTTRTFTEQAGYFRTLIRPLCPRQTGDANCKKPCMARIANILSHEVENISVAVLREDATHFLVFVESVGDDLR